jgi:hypothetical protein
MKEDIRRLITIHRERYAKYPCTGCPFEQRIFGYQEIPYLDKDPECLHCVEVFPVMIDYLREDSVRANTNYISTVEDDEGIESFEMNPACPCRVLGVEVVTKLVSMYMGEY